MGEKSAQEKSLPEKASKVGGARPGAGRPALVPTQEERERVAAMSGYGVPMEGIAALVCGGIDRDTLGKHFAKELAEGRARAQEGVGRTLWEKAMSGDTASMIWYSKAQMRWREETNTQAAAPVTINLAWLPGRGVDAGYSEVTPMGEVIDAQPIGMIEESGQPNRVTNTMGDAGGARAVENDPLPPRSSGGGGHE